MKAQENLPPELQAQMQQMQGQLPPEMLQETTPEESDRLIALAQMNQPSRQNQARTLTQPAVESLLAGINPTM